MRRTIIALLIALLLGAFALLPVTTTVTGQSGPAAEKFYRSQNPVPDQYLVIFNETLAEEDLEPAANDLTSHYSGELLQCPYAPGVNGFSVRMSEANAISLSEDEMVQYVQEIPSSGFPRSGSGTNVALAANGAQAFASSTFNSNYPVSAIINGDRRGTGWGAGTGGWTDATPGSFPDYLEIHFNGEKAINQVDLFTLQDTFKNPAEPTEDTTFSQYGVTSFRLNYWDSATAQWVMLTQVDGNDKVWRTVTFPTVVTPKLSIMILAGANNSSRVVEVEAWQAPEPSNVALAANGGQASASSTLDANYPASALINGDRKGAGWGAGTGGWHDATGNSFPDYLELQFNGEKIINEVDFFTLQDNFNSPIDPSLTTTFSQYGVTDFRVSYWNAATSQWVTLQEIHGSNKVWQKITFDPVQTAKLSIAILNGATNHSRVTEVEAWGSAAPQAIAEETPAENEIVLNEPDPGGEELTISPNPGGGGGDQTSAATVPTPTPTPIHFLKLSNDKKYFVFENKAIALVGNSASYVPHIARNRTKNNRYDPVFENCTFDELVPAQYFPDGTKKRKFHTCVDQIVAAGLNHMQIWVSLNHSLGKLRNDGTNPINNTRGTFYDNEQPFKLVNGKWDLQTPLTNPTGAQSFNNQFFNNLREVVSYCQDKRVLVGVVLFDPWSAWEQDPAATQNDVPLYSPWWPANNNLLSNNPNNHTIGQGFTDPRLFVKADNNTTNIGGTATNPIDSTISDSVNQTMRKVQVALLKRTVTALKDYRNFYWVLGNEVDFDGAASGRPLITWLKYMANNIRAAEPAANRHLIAANVTSNPTTIGGYPARAISEMAQFGNVDIITSHYVQLTDDTKAKKGPVIRGVDRYGALELLQEFNKYTLGAPNIDNTKLWGFSEDKPTGVRTWNPAFTGSEFKLFDQLWSAAAVRVEAWEFLMNGGALMDHLSYRWGNLPNTMGPTFTWNQGNEPQAFMARNQLGYLNKFMRTLELDGMKRLMLGETTSWISTALRYEPSSYWAAMSRPRVGTKYETFLFYFHRSTPFNGAVKYQPRDPNDEPTTVKIKVTQMPNVGCYQADWYYPGGETIEGRVGLQGDALRVVQTGKFYSSGTSSWRELTSPRYKQDVLLKISWYGTGQCPAN